MDMDILINQALRPVDIWGMSIITVLAICLVAIVIATIIDMWRY